MHARPATAAVAGKVEPGAVRIAELKVPVSFSAAADFHVAFDVRADVELRYGNAADDDRDHLNGNDRTARRRNLEGLVEFSLGGHVRRERFADAHRAICGDRLRTNHEWETRDV